MSDQGDIVCCPYDATHKMLRKRLIPHLLKCRRSHPDIELKTCPFNQTHLVPEEEFVRHVTSCQDRKAIADYKFGAPIKDEEKPEHPEVTCEDNWDNDFVQDYTPTRYSETKQELRPDPVKPLISVKNVAKLKEEFDECKPLAMAQRPVTPPPPTGMNWRSIKVEERERSRSPIQGIRQFKYENSQSD